MLLTGKVTGPRLILLADAARRICLPEVDLDALAVLKFSEALPERLALATAAARVADVAAAERVLAEALLIPGLTS